MSKIDVHMYKRRLEVSLKSLSTSKIPEDNRRDILDFHQYIIAEGLSVPRQVKYIYSLIQISDWLGKSFRDVKKADILNLVNKIEQMDYAEHTKRDYKVVIKRFFKWMEGGDEYPEEVKWIKTTLKNDGHLLPEELLTPEDVEKLINAADHPRNKALVACLYETGCRVGEILSLRLKNIMFDDYGAKIIVEGKTGMRRIRIVSSVPHLATWIENHPLRDNPEAPLWVGIGTRNKNGAVKYRNTRNLLVKLSKKAGIKKRVNPHMFRHSRATHLANHLTEAQMNQYFGWVQGSDMPSTYVHLSGRDVDGAILNLYGLKEDKGKDKEEFSPVKCPRCGTMNSPGGKFCIKCGMPLDIKAAIEIENERKKMDDIMSALMKDSEVQRLMARKIKEMGLGA